MVVSVYTILLYSNEYITQVLRLILCHYNFIVTEDAEFFF